MVIASEKIQMMKVNSYFRGVIPLEASPERTIKRKYHLDAPKIFQSILRFFKAFFSFSFFGPICHQCDFIRGKRSVFNNPCFCNFYFAIFNDKSDDIPFFKIYAEKFANLLRQCDLPVFFNLATEYLHNIPLSYLPIGRCRNFSREFEFCQNIVVIAAPCAA